MVCSVQAYDLWFIDIGRYRSFWECLEIDIDVGHILLG